MAKRLYEEARGLNDPSESLAQVFRGIELEVIADAVECDQAEVPDRKSSIIRRAEAKAYDM